jgi:hypothetical protein
VSDLEGRERVGKIVIKVRHDFKWARRKLYRLGIKMPSLSCVLSLNRNAMPLLVICCHRMTAEYRVVKDCHSNCVSDSYQDQFSYATLKTVSSL